MSTDTNHNALTPADLSRLTAKLDTGGAGEPVPRAAVEPPVVRVWERWPTPVRAACYTTLDDLDAIHAWVKQLHDDWINPDVVFSVEDDTSTTVGVLHDPGADPNHRWAVLRHGGFLVLDGRTLMVFDEKSFHTEFCDPAYSYRQRAGR